ncbi:MAG: metallophosphoesterase family protein [Syntrophomonas sp.]|nr:metallophosphoesterase family protein [Syntrophomonas sp.]
MLLGLRFMSGSKRMVASFIVLLMLFSLSVVINPEMATAETPSGMPDQIMLSWTADPLTTQTIAWRAVTDAGQQRVQYLSAASFSGSFTGATEGIVAKTELYAGYCHFETTLSGLSANSRYIYRVGCEGAWSEPASFSTATSGDKFSFVYMGDIQEGYEIWGGMLQRVAAANPRFVIQGGDIINEVTITDEWQQFFTAASPLFKEIPFLPTSGNHDNEPIFWDSFALPQNGPEGYKEKFYSFNYGNCHITVLDSNLMGASAPQYTTVKSWLENDLTNSTQQWKFVVFHYPPYPVVDDMHSYNLQKNWVPLFEQCGVDIVFVGHQHVYMRTKPLKEDQVQADGQGIVYIMGNSGSKFYKPGTGFDYIAKEIAYVSNYQLISIDGDSLVMTSRDADGKVIDIYTLGNVPAGNTQYMVDPVADDSYEIETTAGGTKSMKVKTGISGMKYFTVKLTPVIPHEGTETLVFVHLRNGTQLGVNVTQTDFDFVNSAQAGFKVEPDDIVKAYVLDNLSSAIDSNPIGLQ